MFVTFFDQAYAEWGSILLSSLMKFHQDDSVLVLGVDLSAETERAVARMHERIAVRRLTLDEAGSGRRQTLKFQTAMVARSQKRIPCRLDVSAGCRSLVSASY
jgi:hypothetical protein